MKTHKFRCLANQRVNPSSWFLVFLFLTICFFFFQIIISVSEKYNSLFAIIYFCENIILLNEKLLFISGLLFPFLPSNKTYDEHCVEFRVFLLDQKQIDSHKMRRFCLKKKKKNVFMNFHYLYVTKSTTYDVWQQIVTCSHLFFLSKWQIIMMGNVLDLLHHKPNNIVAFSPFSRVFKNKEPIQMQLRRLRSISMSQWINHETNV